MQHAHCRVDPIAAKDKRRRVAGAVGKGHLDRVPTTIVDAGDLLAVVDRDLVFLRAVPQTLDQIRAVDPEVTEARLLPGFRSDVDFAQDTARYGVQDGFGDGDAEREDRIPEAESVQDTQTVGRNA